MVRSVEAYYVNPAMLKWAREASGFDKKTISRRISVSEEILSKIENGEEPLTVSQLRSLSKAYKRPSAIFYLKQIPKDIEIPDFRTIKIKPVVNASNESLNTKIREIYEKRKNAIIIKDRLEKTLDYSFLKKFSITMDEKHIAEQIRSSFNVKTDDLKGLKDYDVLNYWKNKIEEKNILVFQFQRINLEITRGFVISEIPYPTIAINSGDSYYARVFTLLHEFCHIILQKTGLCNSQLFEEGNIDHEVFCNRITSLVLVPLTELKEKTSIYLEPSKRMIKELSDYFKVSYSVILFQLSKILKIKTQIFSQLLTWIKNLQKRSLDKDSSNAKMSYYTVFFSRTSKTYLNLIFTGYYNEKISYYEALDYVGEKMETFENIHNQFLYGEK